MLSSYFTTAIRQLLGGKLYAAIGAGFDSMKDQTGMSWSEIESKFEEMFRVRLEQDLIAHLGNGMLTVGPGEVDPGDDKPGASLGIEGVCYCVSLKDSDPAKVIEGNRRFAHQRPDVPLHLGVTEAGLPPDGIIKTRIAFEQLISRGIGDTIRVSLTVPNARKGEEIAAGRQILADIAAGRVRSVVDFGRDTLNIISCPSCSRVENEAFIELAQDVKELTRYAAEHAITIADARKGATRIRFSAGHNRYPCRRPAVP